jgi:archaemetzincin
MKSVYLKVIGHTQAALLETLRESLCGLMAVPVKIIEQYESPQYAFDPKRNQYYARKIIERLMATIPHDCEKLIGVTDIDLCTPVLTFVYGEAQLNGTIALISSYRLRPEFFNLAPNDTLLGDRMTKECIHELGHCYGLFHCNDTHCVMFFSNSVVSIDNKRKDFCRKCRQFFDMKTKRKNHAKK